MPRPLLFPEQQYTANMSGRERSRESGRVPENSENIKRGEEADKDDARISVRKLGSVCMDLV